MISPSERGEQARNYFIEVEAQYNQGKKDLTALSPELQVLINLELKSKEQDRQINELRLISNITKSEIKGIRDVVSLSAKNWRDATNSLIKGMAAEMGDKRYFGYNIGKTYAESYELLNSRLGVNLKKRLTELRKRAGRNGLCKTQLDALCYLDVIEKDKKLIEGYLAIVKEMAIKYGVNMADAFQRGGVAQ